MSAKDKAKRNVRIFLSYASEDKNRAAELINQLSEIMDLYDKAAA